MIAPGWPFADGSTDRAINFPSEPKVATAVLVPPMSTPMVVAMATKVKMPIVGFLEPLSVLRMIERPLYASSPSLK